MDLNKAIRSEMIEITCIGQVRASEAWYDRARKERDFYKQDYFQNCAIFRSKLIAKQETLKMHQKEFANKVFSKDSGSAIMHFNPMSLGLSQLKSSSDNLSSDCESIIVTDFKRGQQWMSEYSRESPISESSPLISALKTLSKDPDEDISMSFVIAWMLMRSGYVKNMIEDDLKFWSKDLRILEAISDQCPALRKQCLWELGGFTRYQIRKSLATLQKKLGLLFPGYVIKKGIKNELVDFRSNQNIDDEEQDDTGVDQESD